MRRVEKNEDKASKFLLVYQKGFPYLEVIIAIFLPLLVVISALLLKFTFNFQMDSDPLWSIAVGEWINNNRTVPYIDVFSWTVAGEQWFSNSWLFCWLMYQADQSIGYLGIALIIFISCLITGYFLFFMCKKYQDSTFGMLVAITGIFIVIYAAVTPRAYIYTFAFVAIIMFLIRFKRDTRLIYFIPLIFLIWANIQSSYSFGFAILLLEAVIGTIFYKDKRLWPIVALSFPATLINPYGFTFWDISFSGIFKLGTPFISEWRAPDFNEIGMLALYLLMFIFGMLGASRLKDDLNNNIYDRNKIMILFWFWAALLYSLTTIRAISYVLLLIGPLFAAFATKSTGESRYLKPVVMILVLLLFVAAVTSSFLLLPLEIDPHSGKPVNFVDYLQINPTLHVNVSHLIPAGAIDYLKNNPAKLERLFNSYLFGGYLLYNNIEVYIDARESVFTRHNVMQDYVEVTAIAVDPEIIIDKYEIKTFLLSIDERLIFYLDLHPEWERVYEDDTAVIFTRGKSD